MASGEIGGTRIFSDDGTEIGWCSTGSGPGLVVVPGTLRAARHYADLAAVLADTGARFVFGHSYGGLIALETLLRRPDTGIDALALYESAVSIDHCIPFDWLPELDRAVAEGRTADGVTVLMSGLDLAGPLGRVPMRLRRLLPRTMLRGTRSRDHPRDTVDLLHTRLPKAHVAALPKAGHNAPDLDAPRAVAEQLLAFFGRDR